MSAFSWSRTGKKTGDIGGTPASNLRGAINMPRLDKNTRSDKNEIMNKDRDDVTKTKFESFEPFSWIPKDTRDPVSLSGNGWTGAKDKDKVGKELGTRDPESNTTVDKGTWNFGIARARDKGTGIGAKDITKNKNDTSGITTRFFGIGDRDRIDEHNLDKRDRSGLKDIRDITRDGRKNGTNISQHLPIDKVDPRKEKPNTVIDTEYFEEVKREKQYPPPYKGAKTDPLVTSDGLVSILDNTKTGKRETAVGDYTRVTTELKQTSDVSESGSNANYSFVWAGLAVGAGVVLLLVFRAL